MAFTGMEHGPQVLLAVLVTTGLIEWLREPCGAPSRVLLVALWLGPLVRFEGFPGTWTPIGQLKIERVKALTVMREVTMFATRPEVVVELRAKLTDFGEGLPRGAVMVLSDAEAIGLQPRGRE